MTGYVFAAGRCISCRKIFTFNPCKVPSVTIDGEREPICKQCVQRINPVRRQNGVPEIVPLPDAYEACDEDELLECCHD